VRGAGLPDGLFSYQKSKFGNILEGLGMEKIGVFYDHLEYFTAIWYNLLPFGIICGRLVYFSHFSMFGPRKIWQPWRGAIKPDHFLTPTAYVYGML
jgi:hypothetical protein